MAKLIDLTGQRFDKLTVIEKAPSKNRHTMWRCKCDCGTILDVSGEFLKRKCSSIRDCGCSKKREKQIKIKQKEEKKNYLIGKKFGKLTVIKRLNKSNSSGVFWLCQCDCGKTKEVPTNLLTSNRTQSCGCLKKEKRIDITNQKFGLLTALYPLEREVNNNYKGSLIWHCKCDCGNECNVDGYNLRKGLVHSCGCINYSIGEKEIEMILKNNKIKFKKEYTEPSLFKKRFDFAIFNHENKIIRLVEFDGEQHYFTNKGYWKSENPTKDFEIRKQLDQDKNEWCKNNNIPLVRIPYWERDKITLDMIMGDKYLV